MPTFKIPSIMPHLPFSPTITPLQAATYLLFISLFSISFLVFLNSALSFVLTDLLGYKSSIGDIVGTLGFTDEVVALIMCPVWGLLSDRLGVRQVAVTGYAIVGVSLVVFVQANNVYPQLLLARILFAIGATASTTMVTAILPSLTSSSTPSDARASDKNSVLAGFVGLFTGLGALVALSIFLPLPAYFASKPAVTPAEAITSSFYVVAAVAILVAIFVSFGLRGLKGEENKDWYLLFTPKSAPGSPEPAAIPYRVLLLEALKLAFTDANVALAYLSAFVARASTVSITLFIPLFINTFFISHGFCHGSPHDATPDIKKECRSAYILAAILTGIAQMIGLICAPIFGYLARRPGVWNGAMIISTVSGVVAYIVFPLLETPELKPVDGRSGNPWVLAVVSLMGVSQIGAIVCSLGSLGREITDGDQISEPVEGEEAPLLDSSRQGGGRFRLKGSIAGVSSWCGGVAILLLTKVGGWAFDRLGHGAPFWIMAAFNGVLLVTVLAIGMGRTMNRSLATTA